ncbi:hypothetical protein CDD81_1890 [Ophiocordyceps australis]|uniref:ASTRA-associated protein 1 n=1 Tax=Ophiocordyceps australis TaxID=1399860 RepID=A0A2C5XYU6_9HYPO|nr:hypothetical protein CDD81_1890 [Ophiocordyceps australis]
MAELPRPVPRTLLRGHKAQVHAAAFIRDNERLVTGDADGFVVLWDLVTMRAAAVWKAHEMSILGVQGWGRDKVITHGRDHKLMVWSLAAHHEQHLSTLLPVEDASVARRMPWLLHLLDVNTLNFCPFAACPSARQESSAGIDGASDILVAVPNTILAEAIDIYTLPSQSRAHTIKPGPQNGMVMSLCLLHHRTCLTLLAGFENGYTSVHRLEAAGQWLTTYRCQAHSQPVLSIDVHPNHECFFSSAADAMLVKHPVPIDQQPCSIAVPAVERVAGHDGPPTRTSSASLLSSALRAEGASVTSRPSANLKAWEHPLKTVDTKHSGQQSLSVRSDGKIFATAGWDSNIRVYSCKTIKELAVLQWHKVGAYAVAFAHVGQQSSNPRGQICTAQSTDAAASDLHLASSFEHVKPLDEEKSLRISTDTTVKQRRIRQAKAVHWIAAGAKDGKVSLWDVY